MNFTQEQIWDLLFELANKKGGTHLLLNMTLEVFMKVLSVYEANLPSVDSRGAKRKIRKNYLHDKFIENLNGKIKNIPKTNYHAL